MKLHWPEKLPSDPFKAAEVIFHNLEAGKGTDYLVAAMNENRKNKSIIVTHNLLKNAKVISLETGKIKLLERWHGIKLFPLVLVLPEKEFDEIILSMNLSVRAGSYFHANENLPFPFNKVGFCLIRKFSEDTFWSNSIRDVMVSGDKLTKVVAWHEMRHHIYETRTKGIRIPAPDHYILTQIFAFVADVKSGAKNWIDVHIFLERSIKELFHLPENVRSKYGLLTFRLVPALDFSGFLLFQRDLDEIILKSKSVEELVNKLNEITKEQKAIHNALKFFKILTQERLRDGKYMLSYKDAIIKVKQLGPRGFIKWARAKIVEIDAEDPLKIDRKRALQLLKEANVAVFLRLEDALLNKYKETFSGHMILQELFTDLVNYLSNDEIKKIMAELNRLGAMPDHLGVIRCKLEGNMKPINGLRRDALKMMEEKGWKRIE